MGNSVKIAASVIAANPLSLGEEIRSAEKAGADLFHLDVMDGFFVPNMTFGQEICISICKFAKIPVEIHLMIDQVDRYIDSYVDTGAGTVIVHYESVKHLDSVLRLIKSKGCRAGIALNPATSESSLDYIIDIIDQICVMTVNPGFGGQKFLSNQLRKIEMIRKKTYGKHIDIEVDGGINSNNSRLCIDAGSSILVAGTSVFKASGDYSKNISSLR